MPDIVMHAVMGKRVRQRLGLDLNDELFRFGLLGPDPFLYCWPKYNHYSSIMHRQRCGDFLLELAKRTKNKDTFSYLCGFLCHYALDSLAHPYIISLANSMCPDKKQAVFMHIAIEHRLDRDNGGRTEIPPFPSRTIRRAFEGSIEKVYGWKDAWKKLKAGYWHIKPFYAIIRDRYGVVNGILSPFKGSPAMVSAKSRVCDGLDMSDFYPLLDASVEDAVKFIKCAGRFVNGKSGTEEFRTVIGDRSYI